MCRILEAKEKALNVQIDLVEQMQSAGFNLIRCNNCSNILICKSVSLVDDEKETDVICDCCLHINTPNDCCDYLYEGMPMDEETDLFENDELKDDLDEFEKLSNETIVTTSMTYRNNKMVFFLLISDFRYEYKTERQRNKDFFFLKQLFSDKFKFQF